MPSACSSRMLRPLSLLAYMLVPLLDRPTEGGGEGPPALRGPGGKLPFMAPLEPPEFGGDTMLPRFFAYGSSLMFGYLPTDHSLPPRETGERGALRPFMVDLDKFCMGICSRVEERQAVEGTETRRGEQRECRNRQGGRGRGSGLSIRSGVAAAERFFFSFFAQHTRVTCVTECQSNQVYARTQNQGENPKANLNTYCRRTFFSLSLFRVDRVKVGRVN